MATPIAPIPSPYPRRRRRSTLWTLAWISAVILVAGGALMGGVFALLGNSEVCKSAVEQAQSNPVVVQRLGEPIKRGWPVQGNIQVSGPSGNADLAIPLSGSKSKGTLHAVAEKKAGIWKLETLELAVENSPDRIDLLTDVGPAK